MDWYYTVDGEQKGPVSLEALQKLVLDGALGTGDMVWNEQMGEQWKPAGEVSGLFETESRVRATSFAPPPGGLRPDVSCVAPVGPAWERMRDILFRPFDIGKWFVLGFSAWLATLGEGGGGGPMGNSSGVSDWQDAAGIGDNANPQQMLEALRQFFEEYGGMILTIGGLGLLFAVTFGLAVVWLQCRGRFMFLDNVIHNRSEVVYGWKAFKQHANSLFLWRLVYGIICLAIFMVLTVIGFFSLAEPIFKTGSISGMGVVLSCNIGLWTLVVLIMAYIGLFLKGFIVPLMYGFDLTATEAWHRFMDILWENMGRFVLFGIFYVLLGMLFGTCILILIPLTCCLLGCALAVPYLGTVALLPMLVFFRLYTVYYLEQFGPEYRIKTDSGFAAEEPEAAV